MPTALFFGALALVALYAMVDHYLLRPRHDRAAFGNAWDAYQYAAFHPKEVRAAGPGIPRRIVRVGTELVSTGGKRAVQIRAAALAMHEVRQDGAFSSRGPYLVKRRPLIWAPSGRLHLIELDERTTVGSNPQGGAVYEVGIRVTEWDTPHHAPVSLREFAVASRGASSLVARMTRALPGEVSAASFERWNGRLENPIGSRGGCLSAAATMIAVGLSVAFGDAAPGGSPNWGLGVLFAFLFGSVLAMGIAGLLVPFIARRLILTRHPEAERVWRFRRAVERQFAAHRQLQSLTHGRPLSVADDRATRAVEGVPGLAATIAQPVPGAAEKLSAAMLAPLFTA